ncbi:MAG TPA: Maf family nucleotide pyrophosphatase [Nevskiaceae bacterium]
MPSAAAVPAEDAPADLWLASASPRRAELLAGLGLRLRAVPSGVAEHRLAGQSPRDYVLATALAKAHAVAARAPAGVPVLGADTDVVVDDDILGKPRDRADALTMLARLSDGGHDVLSAVAVVTGDGCVATVVTSTRVCFGPISPAAAAAYWATGEPRDKAGAYAVQGGAARWVRRIEGSYTGVVGLPLFETLELLARFGVRPPPGGAT